ncbi:hypothetical protein [Streptomyces sp. NPDC058424]|uniref:hypothetical protein n=1 Tax=Streptomyces sp. NPDC058424 TaxID=3346491 RepID=UPI00364846B2
MVEDPTREGWRRPADQGLAQGGPSRERHLLAGEFSDLLEKIRGLKGFHTFALPPAMDELRAQAAHGPVVVFNISQYRSDALLLARGGVASLNLPGLAYGTLIERITTFQQALQEASGDDAEKRVAAQPTISGIPGREERLPTAGFRAGLGRRCPGGSGPGGRGAGRPTLRAAGVPG